MENVDLLLDLALAVGTATLGGLIAHWVRLPAVLGYLLAGVLVGPYTMGPAASTERVQTLANLGVALLMFALGTEFSLSVLQRVRRVAVGGGVGQLLLTIGLGAGFGLLLGYGAPEAIFLGGIVAVSSSVFMLKMLMARDELDSMHGRVTIGIGIVQDISMIALIIILPSLGSGAGVELVTSAGLAVLRGAAILVVAYVVGTRLVPLLLAQVARLGSRELFLLSVVAIAASASVLGHLVGLSFALGAFVGGLITSESEFSHHVIDEIIPLREVFSTIFFVSVGMLMDPAYILSHTLEIGLMLAVIVLGKFLLTAGLVFVLGRNLDAAIRSGLLLAQIGEFSFVLASVGLERKAISEELYYLVLASALVSLLINPILVSNSGKIARLAERVGRGLRGRRGAQEEIALALAPSSVEAEDLRRHVVICGYGRVGQEIARALQRRNLPFVVLDYNPLRAQLARDEGYQVIEGDATHPAVLERAGLRNARLVAVTLPDLPGALQVCEVARALNPRVRLLARTHGARSIPRLKQAGAHEVVQPEFEAGLEMMRQALRTYGVSSLETQSIMGGRRREHYAGGPEEPTPASEDTPWS